MDLEAQKVPKGQQGHKAHKDPPALTLWGHKVPKETTETAV